MVNTMAGKAFNPDDSIPVVLEGHLPWIWIDLGTMAVLQCNEAARSVWFQGALPAQGMDLVSALNWGESQRTDWESQLEDFQTTPIPALLNVPIHGKNLEVWAERTPWPEKTSPVVKLRELPAKRNAASPSKEINRRQKYLLLCLFQRLANHLKTRPSDDSRHQILPILAKALEAEEFHFIQWQVSGEGKTEAWICSHADGFKTSQTWKLPEGLPSAQPFWFTNRSGPNRCHSERDEFLWLPWVTHPSTGNGLVLKPSARAFRLLRSQDRLALSLWNTLLCLPNMRSDQGPHDAAETTRIPSRLETIGSLALGIAHDINNMLNPVFLGLPCLAWDPLTKDQQETVEMMRESSQRISIMTRQMLTFARQGIIGNQTVSLGEILEQVLRFNQRAMEETVRLKYIPPDKPIWVQADSTELFRMFTNLLVNARDAMPRGGTITLRAQSAVLPTGLEEFSKIHHVVRVEDLGEGIPPELRELIFLPMFTTKAEKGTGMGLAMAREQMRHLGGWIHVDPDYLEGTAMILEFPLLLTEPSHVHNKDPMESKAPVKAASHPRACVLVVDDMEEQLEVYRRTLRKDSYEVLEARDGTEAISVYAKHRHRIDLMIIDVVMPIMDGTTLARAIHEMNPSQPIMFATAVGTEGRYGRRLRALRHLGIKHVLQKPFSRSELLETVSQCLRPQG